MIPVMITANYNNNDNLLQITITPTLLMTAKIFLFTVLCNGVMHINYYGNAIIILLWSCEC